MRQITPPNHHFRIKRDGVLVYDSTLPTPERHIVEVAELIVAAAYRRP